MPELRDGTSKKRKRSLSQVHTAASVSNKRDEILLLESQILESRRHYNSILTLLCYVKEQDSQDATDQNRVMAAVALCRVFCRLKASGKMSKSREISNDETVIVQWLEERFQEYQRALLSMLALQNPSVSTTALTLLMQLIMEEGMQLDVNQESIWCGSVFLNTLQTLVEVKFIDDARAAFVEKYFVKYDDIRYHTLTRLMLVQP